MHSNSLQVVILSFVYNLIIPTVLLIIGLILFSRSKKSENKFISYRSKRAMKSMESFKEANKMSGNILVNYSVILLIISLVLRIILNSYIAGRIALVIIEIIFSLLIIVLTIKRTENFLKEKYGD